MNASLDDVRGNELAAANQLRLKLYFASLSCLGGLVLGSGQGAETVPVIAIFFAVLGFVLVDWLQWFALPPILAYILMGVAAIYCVSDFWHFETPGNQQMLSVAQLLVFVQSILMLQKKTPRIFEQLAVFCLLELVVAAVFNDAVVYGLLLLPIGLIGAWSLAMLSSVSACEGLDAAGEGNLSNQPVPVERWQDRLWFGTRSRRSAMFRFSSVNSVASLASPVGRMRRYSIMTLTPGIALIGAVFFYAIPRTTDAARMQGRGNVLVGFDDQIRLEQIGNMLESTAPAIRVRLSNRRTARPYMVVGAVYLRGQVLEEYQPISVEGKLTGTWSSVFAHSATSTLKLPGEYFPAQGSDRNFFDSVSAEFTCEMMGSPTLFSIAPYFRVKDEPNILHGKERWTIARFRTQSGIYPRTRYLLGTHAFRGGVQTDMVAAPTISGIPFRLSDALAAGKLTALGPTEAPGRGSYLKGLLDFDKASMPTLAQLAKDIRGSIPRVRRTKLEVAKAFERHLAFAGGYDYTLNLTADTVAGMDPIEQFISIDRRGHCQYFASALTMMLRSVKIPARIVVGYRTDEYSEIGQYYLARQNHAHAWVEALIESDQMDSDRLVYGQPDADQYWIRLDPTPGGGGVDRVSAGGVEQVLNLAKDMWDEYVVEMDARRQNQALSGKDGDASDGSYGSLVRWIQQKVAAIRANGLGGGSLALRDVFSIRGAAIAVILACCMYAVLQLRLPRWFRRSNQSNSAVGDTTPRIPFYANALDELARLGLRRGVVQTPHEFSGFVAQQLKPADVGIMKSLHNLTTEFCRQRYGEQSQPGIDVDANLTSLSKHIDDALHRWEQESTTQQPYPSSVMEQQP